MNLADRLVFDQLLAAVQGLEARVQALEAKEPSDEDDGDAAIVIAPKRRGRPPKVNAHV